ncbi:hypothetical protein GCM10027046_17130 [Uliginosibacterium flavum]|uniref:Uncharacterized protein n=1 Tax=Uliginosibacterium flavum TaxID=1396831 RepID=A0ABV2TPJ2_9RHOO
MNVSADPNPESARTRHIIIALIVAALLVFLARFATDSVLPPQLKAASAAPAIAASAPPLPAADSLIEEKNPAEVQARQARIEREKQQIAADQARRDERLKAAIATRDQASEITRLDQERMDQAWGRFYKKPKKCDVPTDQNVIVECGNHFIRERQRFEKLWADGKISAR